MDTNIFEKKIKPFFWVQHVGSVSVCLNVGNYKKEIFLTRADEGFEGNGYDWTSLAKVFLEEKQSDLLKIVNFDPEADMFCAFSSNEEALRSFILSFKDACENDILIRYLISKAEIN